MIVCKCGASLCGRKPFHDVHSVCLFVQEEQVAESPNVEFTPVVTLPEVETRTLEEDEEEIFKMLVS